MAAEFYISFKNRDWYLENLSRIEEQISRLKTFTIREGNEFRLLGSESRIQEDGWSYDVRLFTQDAQILMEISAHPESVEADLSYFLSWLRSQTDISVNDEDGELSGW
ncbi:uncharacterized protein sS8_1064 [Methylocaldum marinum]|jgi:hypothetical protein|uniref:Uncharacterized protein n=1 Tax=Methylocaldum marinum TaxID=1432792 RepID=A0A250KNA5_9GAMM|nr:MULTISPECIES: hypothetical protein [Methylocaldum]BBA33026.1 uncharacterized protein sS8_1064 [Methylocaldum marinum]